MKVSEMTNLWSAPPSLLQQEAPALLYPDSPCSVVVYQKHVLVIFIQQGSSLLKFLLYGNVFPCCLQRFVIRASTGIGVQGYLSLCFTYTR